MELNQVFSNFTFRKAHAEEAEAIWGIIQEAIEKRKAEGSRQWQDGYPNLDVVKQDIATGYGYVSIDEEEILTGYLALIYDGEPAYDAIQDQWLTNRPYAVAHRIAVSQDRYKKGQATWMLEQAERQSLQDGYLSLKVDTNFDNEGMLRVLEKRGYVYCGDVYFRGSARKAFEKMLDQ
ncbi:GNAT family N-acetyltransferase [Sphingobacterium lactis]|uniref:Acetyltransferase (GNAT) family protein n=1 Tax=Sphingobacterium lactis TaxID=797291 RepID=A0A1H6BI61_9SPHI|nr:GNAT family N-acetyltransferase [Sphingobacterium lactis]SEG60057.1 Acetyltransferase (GNAT) family protein [Sphingobacterium lactis]